MLMLISTAVRLGLLIDFGRLSLLITRFPRDPLDAFRDLTDLLDSLIGLWDETGLILARFLVY